jgi:hypothetical protein
MGEEISACDPIHHIAINVADIERSVQWYTSSARCKVIYRDVTQAILQFRNVRVVLVLPSQTPSHLALIRDDAATLGELRLNRDGTSSTIVSDPTGNLVEIVDSSSLPEGDR